jgi:DNA-binding response OmpR family regulator
MRQKKILLLVDEPDMTSLFKRMMKSVGFNVDVFNDAGQTLKNFKPRFYDLVVLDIIMPKMSPQTNNYESLLAEIIRE